MVLIVSLAIVLVILLVMFAGCMTGQQPVPVPAAQHPGPDSNGGGGRRRRSGAGSDDDSSGDEDYYNGDSDASAVIRKRVTFPRRRG